MPTTCETYLEDITNAYSQAKWQTDTFLTPLKEWFQDAVYTHYKFNDVWRQKISSMVTTLEYITKYLIWGNSMFYMPLRIPYYLTNCIEAKIDMSAILEAMENAEPHQPLLFIAYEEAYRASVWNATFDERFFADLVKKWSIWE